MGNLMLMFVIALLVRDLTGHDWLVTEAKVKQQNSIEVLMESNVTDPDTRNPKVNRVTVNSTYDESIFISTVFKQGVNVTVIQDGKSAFVAEKTVSTNEELARLEESVKEIMQCSNVIQHSSKVAKLLEAISTLQQSSTDKSVLVRLSSISTTLTSHYEGIHTSEEDKKLRKMVNVLEKSLNVMQANNKPPNNLENLYKISEMTQALAIRTGDVGLRNYALNIKQAFEIAMGPFRIKQDFSEKLIKIVTRIREDYFVPENATVLNSYIDNLNELQANLRTPENKMLVKSLKREIVNLTEAIKTIDTVGDVLEAEPEQFQKLFGIKGVDKLLKLLQEISESTRNEAIKIKADELANELETKAEFFLKYQKEELKWIHFLDAINRTLVKRTGLDAKDGLRLHKEKINFVIKNTTNDKVKLKAMSLMSFLEPFEQEIDDLLKVFDTIEKKIRVPENVQEANDLKMSISQIKQINERVHDLSVNARAMEIIGKIEKFLNSYEFLNQIKKNKETLQNMNRSLAMEEKIGEEQEKLQLLKNSVMNMQLTAPGVQSTVTEIMPNIEDIKRSIPARTKQAVFKHEARELLRILNGFLQEVLPEMKKRLSKVGQSCELLEKLNRTNLDGLTDRILIVSKDHARITTGLESIKEALKTFDLKESDFDAVLKFKNFDDTVERMFELENLQEDPYTNDLLKKAFTMVQEVLHANDTLKQLQRMIIFNTKLLNSNDKARTMTEDTKPEPVPVERVSLFPLNGEEAEVPKVENTATEPQNNEVEWKLSQKAFGD